MIKKLSLGILAATSLLFLLFSFKQEEGHHHQLIIGTNAEFAPFSFRENHAIVGFDIDVAKEISLRLGKEAIFKDMPFDALIPDLILGQIDFIAAGMSPTEERAKRVAFTTPYLTEDPLVILSRADGPKLLNVADLKKKKVVVNEGYTADLLLSSKEGLDLIRLSAPVDGFLALKSKRADAFVTASSTLRSFLETQDSDTFEWHILTDEKPETCALVIAKENTILLEHIQSALNAMEQEGVMGKLKKKWGLGD